MNKFYHFMPETKKERRKRIVENLSYLCERDAVFNLFTTKLYNTKNLTEEDVDELNRQMDEAFKRIGAERKN